MTTSTAEPRPSVPLDRLAKARELAASGEARTVRLRSKTSLIEIAEVCGVDTGTVWKWEMGKRRPRGEAAIRYVGVLEMLAKTGPIPGAA